MPVQMASRRTVKSCRAHVAGAGVPSRWTRPRAYRLGRALLGRAISTLTLSTPQGSLHGIRSVSPAIRTHTR
ncbi:hypothetical protein C8J57DRAFT_1478801 [Mycena rebaudengoi]|nr:hypothetical protein C8J57DRAFT_1478801 [Mycena rebaudengoi]